jgi:hypothetical protein
VSWNHPEFSRFDLHVKTEPGLQAISQGEISETSPGQFTFTNNVPLTQISLAIGDYEKKSIQTDSIEFGIWHFRGHDYFSAQFPETADTIAPIIGERMGDFERSYKLDYAFKRMFIVEVPAQFKSFKRIWSGRQEYIQPEQIFIPEKGYLLAEADLEGAKKRITRWGRRGDSNMTPKDIEIRLLSDLFGIFTRENNPDYQVRRGSFSVQEKPNPYFIFPMLYNFQNNIQSEQWPIINRIFEAYLKSQSTGMRPGFMRNMQGMSADELANIALQDSTFEQILADPSQKRIIDNVIKLKGEMLFSMVQWRAGQDEFEGFLREMLRECRFKNIPFEEFNRRIVEEFNVELIPMMDGWFKEKSLPGYLFSAIEAVKVKTGQRMQTKVSLKATNFSDVEGIVKVTFRLGGGGGPGGGRGFGRGPSGDDSVNKLIYLEPQQTKEVSFLLSADPRMVMINTMTSKNIPQVISEGFRNIEEDIRAVPFEGEVISDTPVQRQLPGEIIVDNEDSQFEINVTRQVSLLEKWLAESTDDVKKYSPMNLWRPPVNWTAVTNSDFFGEYVRSAYYIKAGDGSMKAKWHVPLEEPGRYDVYYHMYKPMRFGRGGGDERGEYQFFIHSEEGAVEQTLSIQNAETGWNHLGSFDFSEKEALVELTNKTEARVVFADAVRFVKI